MSLCSRGARCFTLRPIKHTRITEQKSDKARREGVACIYCISLTITHRRQHFARILIAYPLSVVDKNSKQFFFSKLKILPNRSIIFACNFLLRKSSEETFCCKTSLYIVREMQFSILHFTR